MLRFDVTIMNSTHPPVSEILKEIPNYDALLGKVHVDSQFLDTAGKQKIFSSIQIKIVYK